MTLPLCHWTWILYFSKTPRAVPTKTAKRINRLSTRTWPGVHIQPRLVLFYSVFCSGMCGVVFLKTFWYLSGQRLGRRKSVRWFIRKGFWACLTRDREMEERGEEWVARPGKKGMERLDLPRFYDRAPNALKDPSDFWWRKTKEVGCFAV